MFDVQNPPTDKGETPTYSSSYVDKVMWGFSGPFYTVALVAAVAVFCFSTKSSAEARTKELLIMDCKEQFPTKSIDEDYPWEHARDARGGLSSTKSSG